MSTWPLSYSSRGRHSVERLKFSETFRRRYLAHGTATDYMFEELHIPLSFTWEIYGDEVTLSLVVRECTQSFVNDAAALSAGGVGCVASPKSV